MQMKDSNGGSVERHDVEGTTKRSLPDLEPLRPIPIPPSSRWREVRLRFLPVAVFLASLGFAAWLWQQQGAAGTFVANAEGARATVSSPFVGVIQYLNVTLYQEVKKGDAIAVIAPIDPRAQLDVLRSRMQAAGIRIEPSLAQRYAVDFERLRANVLNLKVELAKDRVSLELAENELKRSEQLFRTKLISDDVYDLAVKNRNLFLVAVTEKQRSVADLDAGLERFRILTDPNAGATNSTRLEALDQLEMQLILAATNSGPLTLTAPMSGMISYVYRGTGENVREGEPLVTIQALQPERIVGYLRQPFPFEPEAGMKVEVKTRGRKPQIAFSEIRQVGATLEPITNVLAMARPGLLVDVGLPVVVNLPPGIILRTGETVDVIVRPSPESPAPAR